MALPVGTPGRGQTSSSPNNVYLQGPVKKMLAFAFELKYQTNSCIS
jgi:hypothetical protein